MIDGSERGNRKVVFDMADWRDCDALEWAIEVPMLEPMWIAGDDRRLIAMRVVSVIAMTVRMLIVVAMFALVMVRFIRRIVVMDVRIISAAVPMMNQEFPVPLCQIDQSVSCRKVSGGVRALPDSVT